MFFSFHRSRFEKVMLMGFHSLGLARFACLCDSCVFWTSKTFVGLCFLAFFSGRLRPVPGKPDVLFGFGLGPIILANSEALLFCEATGHMDFLGVPNPK